MPKLLYFGGGRGAVAEYTGFKEKISGGSSMTFGSVPIGAEAADRYVLAFLSNDSSGGPGRTLLSATIGGVSATILVQSVGGISISSAAIIAPVPTGTTADIAVTYDGASFSALAFAYSLTRLRDATPLDTASDISGSTSSFTLSVDAIPRGIVLCHAGMTSTTANVIGADEDYVEGTGFALFGKGGSVQTTSYESPRAVSIDTTFGTLSGAAVSLSFR